MNNVCCDQAPLKALKNLDEAISELQAATGTNSSDKLIIETIPILDALNRTLATDVYSQINVPPADNSAVDGYALSIEDFSPHKSIAISQRIPAGQAPLPLQKLTTARIFTGAHIPEGANAVVMQENIVLNDDKTHIYVSEEFKLGQNIRPMGQDIKKGDLILNKGSVITPQRLALIASVGIDKINVYKALKVAILSTGDELVEPGQEVKKGQIYNSNRYLLSGFLKSLNFDIIDFGVIKDDLDSTLSVLKKAAQEADIVITTGGASVGEEDYIQSAIEKLGNVDFWKVAIKPGKPVMLGNINNTPILGLPGNPGAVFVTFMILARPFLLHKQGLNNTRTKPYSLPINFDIKKAGKRREFMRVRRNANNILDVHPNQSSGMLSSASWAEGLAVIMENTAPQKGDVVDFIPFDTLFNLNN